MEKYNHSDARNDHFEDVYVSLWGNTEDMMLSRKIRFLNGIYIWNISLWKLYVIMIKTWMEQE